MASIDFEHFRTTALAEGFEEVLVRDWEAGTVLDTHSHPFAVRALVVQGDLWLTVNGQTQHLRAGDPFTLGFAVPHAERYGAEGATYWVARRTA